MYTYVVENPDTKTITDFASFYRVPVRILQQEGHAHTHIYAAYSFYNVSTANETAQVMKYALSQAAENGFDVFNALDIMDNEEYLYELKFMPGDGYLHYYLYNWSVSNRLSPQDVALIIV